MKRNKSYIISLGALAIILTSLSGCGQQSQQEQAKETVGTEINLTSSIKQKVNLEQNQEDKEYPLKNKNGKELLGKIKENSISGIGEKEIGSKQFNNNAVEKENGSSKQTIGEAFYKKQRESLEKTNKEEKYENRYGSGLINSGTYLNKKQEKQEKEILIKQKIESIKKIYYSELEQLEKEIKDNDYYKSEYGYKLIKQQLNEKYKQFVQELNASGIGNEELKQKTKEELKLKIIKILKELKK